MASLRPARMISVISDGNFRRLWMTGWLTWTTRWLEILAIGVTVYQLTQSAFQVTLMMTIRMAPMLFLGTFVGALADRVDRKTLLAGGLVVLSLTAACLAAIAFSGHLALWHIGVGALVNGMNPATEMPVRRTMLGTAAGPERMSAALSLDSATNNLTRMIGPILGGVVVERIGLQGAYAIAAVAYAGGVFLVLPISLPPPPRAAVLATRGVIATGRQIGRQIAEGLRFALGNQVIKATLAVTMLVNFWAFSYGSLIPVVGAEDLNLTPTAIGVLAAADALGAFLASLLVAFIAPGRDYTRIYVGGSALFLAGVLIFSFVDGYTAALAVLVFAGFGISGFGAMQSTIILTATPPELRSRVMGVLSMSIGASPLGLLHLGFMAEMFSARTALSIIAIEGLAALALCLIVWPVLWRSRELSPATSQTAAAAPTPTTTSHTIRR
ncbi:MAG: MFS transporter [Alphaproteobacteria bacterium]